MPRSAIEDHREEVERRTAAGETCEQIANALTASGFKISHKTVSRYRVIWGLRQRKQSSTTGRTYPDRKLKASHGVRQVGKLKDQQARRAEITARTQRGESAEQIAAALEAQGFHLKKGASSILRLQTSWELIPYDHDRARGKGVYDRKKHAARLARGAGAEIDDGTPKTRQPRKSRKPKEVLAPANPGETLHYPASCSNGPQNRATANRPTSAGGYSIGPGDDSDAGPDLVAAENVNIPPPSIDVAAELMSAEFLVDLATSTLSAANRVKELYVYRQAQRPAPGSLSGLPPTDDDIATAKRKVREAASVMHDLALPTANPLA